MADSPSSSSDASPSLPSPSDASPKERKGIVRFKVTDPRGNTVVKSLSQEIKRQPDSRPREKVAVERGFSMLHWHQRLRTNSDPQLSPAIGGMRRIGMGEVRQHRTRDSAWTVLRGKVYDMTPFLRYHPGGVDKLMMGAGKDMTALFDKYHAWVNIEFLIGRCCLGVLQKEGEEEGEGRVGGVRRGQQGDGRGKGSRMERLLEAQRRHLQDRGGRGDKEKKSSSSAANEMRPPLRPPNGGTLNNINNNTKGDEMPSS